MRNKMRSLCTLFIVIGTLNLAYPADQPADFSRVEIKSVKLERTECYGRCPVYTIEISSDRTVKFLGKAHVAKLGNQASTVNPGDLEFLAAAIQRLNFFALRDTYASPADGCTEVVTDNPSIIITVQTRNQQKTVKYYGGCWGLVGLGRIAWLADTIDEVAGASQWVWIDPSREVKLEPLVTESFSLRYPDGEDVVAMLTNTQHRILSNRGDAVVDKRYNKLFVTDTPASLEKVREFIKQVDVPGRQFVPK